jgi:hypothetical protein
VAAQFLVYAGVALAYAEKEARDEEQCEAGGEAVQGAGERPPGHDEEEATSSAEAVE